jgi:UDP-N-acetylglucosamine--N-acetylmuramyl-(pentapeptide) pyrophosphoryl-undecaprenol N-acetylglucosamine transferase
MEPTKKSLTTDVGFFCSPIGLGHATRDIAIAQHFEGISAEFITGSGAAKIISDYGFSVIDSYRPPIFDVQNGKLQGSLKWLWSYYQYYQECKMTAKTFLAKQNPRLVVSDEDFASLTVAQKNNMPTILITDILETSFTKGLASIVEKKMNRIMKEIIAKCDTVIIPEFGESNENIKRVGPIVRSTKLSRESIREKFSFDKKTITVCVGGTDAGRFLIEKSVQVFAKLKDVNMVIVSGPSLKLQDTKIRNLGFVPNLHEIIYASDLVISLAGKSTIDEARAYGTPGIFIPIKNHFEQEDNARREGYSYDDVFRLESLILEKIEQKRTSIKTDGAKKASDIVSEYLKMV